MSDEITGGEDAGADSATRDAGSGGEGWWTRPESRLDHVEEGGAVDGAGDRADGDGTPRMSRGRLALLVALVALALVAVGLAVTRGEDPPRVTATTASSTTTIAPWPATEARIATAKNPSIIVHSQPPSGWDGMEPVEAWDNPVPPYSQSTMPQRAPLPSPDLPIQGRYSQPTGWSFNNPTGWGDAFVMLVTEQRDDWLKVEIPVRPNGTPGWVSANDVEMSTTNYRLDLRLGTRTLTLFDGDTAVLSTPVVIGKNETRTPTGRFYITDKNEQTDPAGAYGPIALPTNAYSEQIDEFDNGVPVIALHGTNRPELMGQDVSNGCVRLPNEQIMRIAGLIPAGTPIDIWA